MAGTTVGATAVAVGASGGVVGLFVGITANVVAVTIGETAADAFGVASMGTGASALIGMPSFGTKIDKATIPTISPSAVTKRVCDPVLGAT